MTYDMTGKVALITGGSSGIGLATAHAFAAAGARVAIASRDPDRGRAAEAAVREAHAGAEVLWIQADVSQADQVQALVERVVGTLGGLDFAFNNGGSGGEGGWIVDIGDADFDATVGGYLKSVFLCLKAELKVMLNAGTPEEPAGSGVIVNNASVDGLRAFPWDPVYSAAKHGVLGLTKSVAMQYADKGVRVNAVCPGWIRTPPIERILEHHPEAELGWLQHQPIGRLGRAEEVADAVVWLCSDRASFLVGVALPVDGGYTIV